MDEDDLRMGASNFLYSGFEDMLLDDDRNSKYRRAIQLAVQQKLDNREKAHVLDIGSGTGLLSLYAAAAGATSVTAIELDPVIFDVSLKIAERADNLPQKANIFVSEIVDSELLGENILQTVRHALTCLTTPSVVCIPARVDVFVVPIESALLKSQVCSPQKMTIECKGDFYGIDSHWLTSGRKTLNCACQPIKFRSFVLNDIKSLKMESTKTIEFTVQENVNQIDGVLLWWHLDLTGDGHLVISTGSDQGGPRWRNHWLQVAYGLPRPILVQPNDSLQLRGSHNKDSFWFSVEKVGTNKNEDFVGRQRCTCQWHSTISPNTLLRWNTVYEQSVFVREIVEASLNKTVLCIGSNSLLPNLLKAKKIVLVEENERFWSQISKHCSSEIQFLRDISRVACWNDIDIAIFDVHSNEPSSPVDFARDYFYIRNKHKDIKLLPEKLELKTMPMKFKNLWRRKMRVTKIDEFDYSDFNECFSRNEKTNDDDMELLTLWEERCFANGPETVVFSSTLTNTEFPIPSASDAFVFWFSSTSHCPFRKLDDNEVGWDQGTRQWIYFLTNPDLKTLTIEFNQNDQEEFPHFSLIDKK